MENEAEKFDFVVATDEGYRTESFYGMRHYADKRFEELVDQTPRLLFVAYYAASTGGLVNAHDAGRCK